MSTENCPVCNEDQRHVEFPQLCQHCGWEFRFFLGIPSNDSVSTRAKALQARKEALLQIDERQQRAQQLAQQLHAGQRKLARLRRELNKTEAQIADIEKSIETGHEDHYRTWSPEQLRQEIKRINNRLPQLVRSWGQDGIIYNDEVTVRLHCSLRKESLYIYGDRTPHPLPDLVIGFAREPFFLLETAEVLLRIRGDSKFLEEEENSAMVVPISPKPKPGIYFWRVGLYKLDPESTHFFEIAQEGAQVVEFN